MGMLLNPYRFTSVFTPASVSDMRLWWDVSDTPSLTLSSTDITQINDKSGNSNHGTSAAGKYPQYGTDSTSGLHKATFDGVDDFLKATDSASLDLTTGAGIFIACNVLTSGVTDRVLVTKDSGAALAFNGYTIRTDGSGSNLTAYIGGSAFANVMPHSYAGRHVFAFEYDKVTLRGRKDLTTYGSSAYTSDIVANALDLWVGSRNASSTALNFELFEIIIYGTDPNTTNRDAIENYLKTKWVTT